MTPPPAFGFEQIVVEIIRGLLDTVADTPGLSPGQKAFRQQAAVSTVMSWQPRDPIETMMAGHTLIYDHMLRDGARDMLRGQAELIKIKARPGILSCGKMFLATVDTLTRMQCRPEKSLAFARQLPEQPAAAPQPAHPQEKEPAADAQAPTPPESAVPAAEPAPEPLTNPPPMQPLMSDEEVMAILLDGLDETTQREIREAVDRAVAADRLAPGASDAARRSAAVLWPDADPAGEEERVDDHVLAAALA